MTDEMAPSIKKDVFKGVGQEMSLVYDMTMAPLLWSVVEVPGLGSI